MHCPQCRLTIYGGTAYNKSKRCPRCDTEMSHSPRPLFRSIGLGPGSLKTPPGKGGSRPAVSS